MPRLRLVPDRLQKLKGRTKEALASFRDNGFAQGFQLFLAVHQDEDAAPESNLTMVTDALERHTNVVAGIVPASSVLAFIRWPCRADIALIFGDVVVVHVVCGKSLVLLREREDNVVFEIRPRDPRRLNLNTLRRRMNLSLRQPNQEVATKRTMTSATPTNT